MFEYEKWDATTYPQRVESQCLVPCTSVSKMCDRLTSVYMKTIYAIILLEYVH